MSKLEILAAFCFFALTLWSLLSLVRRGQNIIDGKDIRHIRGVELEVEAEHSRKFPESRFDY